MTSSTGKPYVARVPLQKFLDQEGIDVDWLPANGTKRRMLGYYKDGVSLNKGITCSTAVSELKNEDKMPLRKLMSCEIGKQTNETTGEVYFLLYLPAENSTEKGLLTKAAAGKLTWDDLV